MKRLAMIGVRLKGDDKFKIKKHPYNELMEKIKKEMDDPNTKFVVCDSLTAYEESVKNEIASKFKAV